MQSKDAIEHHIRQKQRRRQGHTRQLHLRHWMRFGRDSKRRYANNAQGRLSRLDTPEGSWHYTYNLDGQRLEKWGSDSN
jgi:YD repeat-containing protein